MKKHLLFVAAVCTALLASADPNDPQVRLVSATMDSSRNLNIQYTLDEPAIVTFDVKTNGVSIGAANLKNASRDVYRVVPAAGGSRTIILPATEALPDSITRRKRAVTVTVTAWATNSPPDYMVIKLVGDDKGARTFYTAPEQLPGEGGVTNDMYKTDYLVMRRIPAAGKTFRMGSPSTENGREANSFGKEPLHYVALTNDFYMAVFELTQGQYYNLLGTTPASKPSYEYTPANPVSCVTISAFLGTALPSIRSIINLPTLDLPTEAEWEFACRAGTLSARYDGSESPSDSTHLAWFSSGSSIHAYDVGLLIPNEYGLYDMYGNVSEVCLDFYVENYAQLGSTVIAPKDTTTGGKRVLRGGQLWWSSETYNRSAWRYYWGATEVWMPFGYRLACTF